MAETKPTRSELIKLKKKIALARSGHDLLKRKRDGLIQEFFNVLENAKERKAKLTGRYKEARTKLAMARALTGTLEIKSAAFALKKRPQLELKARNIMGVVVPKIEAESVCTPTYQRGYGILGSSTYIDELATAYETVLDDILVSAEVETTLKKILLEIEKTKRRVNALEFLLIPTMEKSSAFIKLRLEEMERENVFRLKRVKK
jgi:V/A-type H+-transporting ATPase subunit D